MSFWVVPRSCFDSHALVARRWPRRGRAATPRCALIVIDVFISPDGDAVEQLAHVAEVGDRHADLADLAPGQGVVGVVAGLGGQVEGDRQAGLPLGQVGPVELVATPWPWSGPSRCASSTGDPAAPAAIGPLSVARGCRATCRAHYRVVIIGRIGGNARLVQRVPSAGRSRHRTRSCGHGQCLGPGARGTSTAGSRRRRARRGGGSATARRAGGRPASRSRSTRPTSATFDASVRRWNIDSPANSPPMATPYSPPASVPSGVHASTLWAQPQLVQPRGRRR